MACPGRDTSAQLFTSTHRTGLKFFPYTYIPFKGLYTENGYILKGTRNTGRHSTDIVAPTVDVPKVCCGIM